MSSARYQVVAAEIVAWVKTWKTWREDCDDQAAFEAVLEQIEGTPYLADIPEMLKSADSKERKLAREVRYSLGIIAIEAAKSVDLERIMAEVTAEVECKEQREAERQAKELDAELFLLLRLVDKPVLYRELEQEAKAIGVSAYYLRQARANLGVFTIEGETPAHPRHWALPEWSEAK